MGEIKEQQSVEARTVSFGITDQWWVVLFDGLSFWLDDNEASACPRLPGVDCPLHRH